MPRDSVTMNDNVMNYAVQQGMEFIEWLEKTTGRKFNDELFIKAVRNECRSFRLWAEICTYNQNVPAPLDEKSMYSLYPFGVLSPHRDDVVQFYERLRDEVKDRVERGIAAVGNERIRIMTDAIPPWPFLQVWRYLEREYGAVSIGSLYTFQLTGCFELDDQGNLVPTETPEQKGIELKNREDTLRALIDFRTHFLYDFMNFCRCPDGPNRVIFMCLRNAEECHNSITDKFFNKPFILVNDL